MKKKKLTALTFSLLLLLAGILLTHLGAYSTISSDYEQKIQAAEKMRLMMNAIKDYKIQNNIPLCEEDFHETGMLGEEYTFITTTHGAVDAKRTTANPDMAALLVQMLKEACVRSGDTVGAGFSGSFPALNLAVLSACETLSIRCVYIASVGASTYGANQPELTFPDMIKLLLDENLLSEEPVLFTPGGYDDCGLDMNEDFREEVFDRIRTYGIPLMEEADFTENIRTRMKLYEENGPITCFIGVGGNLTTAGASEEVPYGVIPPGKIRAVTGKSGLIQRYNSEKLPCIHLLNIKKLTADYGLPYDPEVLPSIGESAIYQQTVYPKLPAVLALLLAAITLYFGFSVHFYENIYKT